MNINLQKNIKFCMSKFRLNAKYNKHGKLNKKIKIDKIILENKKLGKIEFDSGQVYSKSILKFFVFFKSSEHNYLLKLSSHKYYFRPKLLGNILFLKPRSSLIIKDCFEDYLITLDNCNIKIYLNQKGLNDLKKYF